MPRLFRLFVSVLVLAAPLAAAQTFTASHSAALDYTPGQNLEMSVGFEYTGALTALGYAMDLPPGWTFVSMDPASPVAPAAGAGGSLEFAWINAPASPHAITIILNAPASAPGQAQIQGQAIYRRDAGELTAPALPDPLTLYSTQNPPGVTATDPAHGAVDVAVDQVITASFSRPMDPATISAQTFLLTGSGRGAIAGAVAYDENTTTASFTPGADLAGSTNYTATLTTDVKSAGGTALIAEHDFFFSTMDISGPVVTLVSPAQGAVNVALDTLVSAEFNEELDQGSVSADALTLRAGAAQVAGTVSYTPGARLLTFTPAAPLAGETAYTAAISGAVTNLAGIPLGADHTFGFTTLDTNPPHVTAQFPAEGALAPVDTALSLTFNEPMDAATINAASITAQTVTRAPIPGAVAYQAGARTAVFTPSADLPFDSRVELTASTALTDLAGNHLAQPFTMSFNTAVSATDSDGDGVIDEIDDHPFDATQASPVAATGTGKVGLSTPSGSFSQIAAVSAASVNQAGRPEGYSFPDGLARFRIEGLTPGATVVVTLTFPTAFGANARYYKVTDAGFALFGGAVINGNVVRLTLTDGGPGDGDGLANGTIADPGGPAERDETPPAAGGGGCFISGLKAL